VRLRLFEVLAAGPQSAASIAETLNLTPDSAELLLDAAVSLDLAERRHGGRFGLGSLGAALVGNPAVGAMVEHHRLLYTDLNDPVGLLRGERGKTQLARYWAYAGSKTPARLSHARTVDYTDLMANSQPLVAGEILDAYPLNTRRCLLDVGGGDGSFLIEAARRHAQLEVILFDLPAVAKQARERFEKSAIAARARAVGGDFLIDPLPEGADVVSLVRVVHDHDDEAARALLRSVHRALGPQGVVLLAEPMLGTPGAEAVGDAYFSFYLLAMGAGRPRSPDQLKLMLTEAGFRRPHEVPTRQPLQTCLILAHRDM
jgi:demethylspheroidene O-methyltransferase